MADFLLDANVDPDLVPLLVRGGHTALTTNDAGRYNSSDDEQLLLATELRRILITHDKNDFKLLFHAWRNFGHYWGINPPEHACVLVLPQHNVLRYSRSVSEIEALLHFESDLAGKLFQLDPRSGWLEIK